VVSGWTQNTQYPYDSGVILCKHEKMLIQSMHMAGSYIQLSEDRDGMLYTAEMSRRARAIELCWLCYNWDGRKQWAKKLQSTILR